MSILARRGPRGVPMPALTTTAVCTWGVATAGTSILLARDMAHAMTVSPSGLADRVTALGVALFGLGATGLAMWRDHQRKMQEQQREHLKAMQEINRGSLAEEVARLREKVEHYEQRDRDQDKTIADKDQLITSQNFELIQSQETAAGLRRALAEKDDTIKTLSLANLVARGYLTEGSLVIPSFLIPTPAHTPAEGMPVVTPEREHRP